MEKAIFTEEMMSVLTSLKGKTFKSYEYYRDMRLPMAYGTCRINLGKCAIQLDNFVEGLNVFGRTEDVPVFVCKEVPLTEPFLLYENPDKRPRVYMVGEKIVGVQVVRDDIHVRSEDDDHVLVDQALRVITVYATYTFWRDWYYSEVINIDDGPEPCEVMSIEKVKYDWGDEGEYPVDVKREVIDL